MKLIRVRDVMDLIDIVTKEIQYKHLNGLTIHEGLIIIAVLKWNANKNLDEAIRRTTG